MLCWNIITLLVPTQSCMVHGGDGFAFVIQLDPNGTTTIGSRGEGLGYAGIRNTLVVEFDTWYNPEQGDLFTDHVRSVVVMCACETSGIS